MTIWSYGNDQVKSECVKGYFSCHWEIAIIVAILRGDFDKFNAPPIRKDSLCFIR